MEIVYIALILLSLIMSFIFSGTETAFVSLNRVRLEVWRRRKDRVVNVILPYVKFPERFLYTTLIGNNIFNVAFATLATVYFNKYLHPEVTWLMIVITTLLIGEIIPKTLFRSLADWVVRKIAYPLHWFYYLFYPVTLLISKISEILLSVLGYQKEELHLFFSKKDVEILINESQNMVKRIHPQEGEIYSAVLSLRELRVRDAMVPRTDIVAVPETISIKDLREIFHKQEYMKIPVYRHSIDNIVGVVFLKDLFLEPRSVQEIIRKIMYVPETKRCSELLSEFRENNSTIAVVIDEYGGTDGLVTTEDLVEVLFGDIEDEYVGPGIWIRKLDEKTFRVNARIEIEKLNETLMIELPEGDYETLAGFILSQLGYIPRRDDFLQYKDIQIIIIRATRRKIESVKIILP